MKNLETVVRERNKAYYLLETGEDGERPGVIVHSAIGRLLFHSIKYVLSKMLMKELIFIYCNEGLPLYHRKTEHVVQKAANKWWKSNFVHHYNYDECRKFLQLYREKLFKENRRHRRSDHSCCIFVKFDSFIRKKNENSISLLLHQVEQSLWSRGLKTIQEN